MKKKIIALLIVVLISISSAFTVFAEEEKNSVSSTVLDVTIPAPSLNNNLINQKNENNIAVYLPPNYETSNKSYPVIYYLPGYGDSYFSYASIFKNNLNEMIPSGEAKEMIVVAVNGMNTIGGSFYANSPVSGNWEDHVTKDVVTYVDSNFRTLKNPESRGLVGHSMGGFGVLNIVQHTKDIFGYAYAMSPGIFGEEGFENFPLNFSLINKDDFKDLNPEEAKKKYEEKYCIDRGWPYGVTFSYAAAFAYNTDTYPYIDRPQQDENGKYLHDDIWKRYEAGYGDVKNKLSTYKDNLLSLKGLVIEYGDRDEFTFIPHGCKYFKSEADKLNIPCDLIEYEGNHQGKLNSRIKSDVILYFSNNLKQESNNKNQSETTSSENAISSDTIVTEKTSPKTDWELNILYPIIIMIVIVVLSFIIFKRKRNSNNE